MTAESDPPLTAVVYDVGDPVRDVANQICAAWGARGLRMCGLLERQTTRPGRARCDMFVTELSSGREISISEDRGVHARGCILDINGLLQAATLMRTSFADGAERAIFNKFGKAESEGGGLRDVIAEAIERRIPSVVFVPRRNLEAWRAFAGDLAYEMELSGKAHLLFDSTRT